MPPLDPTDISLYRGAENIPPEYWEELNRQSPEEVCRRSLVTHDPETGYALPFLNDRLYCRPDTRQIHWERDLARSPSFQEALVSLMYLLRTREIPLSGIKVNEKELNGGALFFRGPHALSKESLEEKFSRDPQGFLRAGLALGGFATQGGDAVLEQIVCQGAKRLVPLQLIGNGLGFGGMDKDRQLAFLFDFFEQDGPLWAL